MLLTIFKHFKHQNDNFSRAFTTKLYTIFDCFIVVFGALCALFIISTLQIYRHLQSLHILRRISQGVNISINTQFVPSPPHTHTHHWRWIDAPDWLTTDLPTNLTDRSIYLPTDQPVNDFFWRLSRNNTFTNQKSSNHTVQQLLVKKKLKTSFILWAIPFH